MNSFKSFTRNCEASVAVIVALGNLAVVFVCGLTVDIARGEYVRERMVSAVDSAALAGGKVINNGGSNQWYADAEMYFEANFPTGKYVDSKGYLGTTVTNFSASPGSNTSSILLSSDQTQLTVNAHANLPTYFMTAFGFPNLPINVSATAYAGKVEVVMVLDNSGSMANAANGGSTNTPKITLLQQAAVNFVNSLTSLGNGNVRIGVVPFNATVNTGYNSNNAPSWIDPTAAYIYGNYLNTLTTPSTAFNDVFVTQSGAAPNPLPNRFTYFRNIAAASSNSNAQWAGCVEMRPPPFDLSDAGAGTDPRSYFVPFFAPAEPSGNKQYGFINPYMTDYTNDDSNNANWKLQQGDVLKYQASWVTSSHVNSGIEASKGSFGYYVTGPNAGCRGYSQNGNAITVQQIQRLTNTTSTLTTEINQMTPMGDTYLPIGMDWAWQIMSPNGVFSADGQAAYDNQDVTKVVIVLTDGCNHLLNPNDKNGSGPDTCGNYSAVNNPSTNPDQSTFSSSGYSWQNRYGPSSATNVALETDRTSVANQEFANICTAMKANTVGIRIYAIGIDSQGSNNPALPACASSPASTYLYLTPDPVNLSSIFSTIASQLTTVRIIVPPSTT